MPVKKLLRRAGIGMLVFTLITSVGIPTVSFAVGSTCPQLSVGDEIKVNDAKKPAIYVLDKGFRPRFFADGDIYKTYKTTYADFKLIDQKCLESLGTPSSYPSAINYRPGSTVVKSPFNDKLYVVEPGNALSPISDSVAKQLYGNGYKAITINPNQWDQYICKKTVEINKPHPGMTVRTTNNTTVYYIDSENKKHEVASSAMTNNFLLSTLVKTVPDTLLQGFTEGDKIIGSVWYLTDRTGSGIGCDGSMSGGGSSSGGGGSGDSGEGNGGNGGNGNGGAQDTTSPSVNIISPTAGNVQNSITVSATASDNVGVTKMELYQNNNLLSSNQNATSLSVTWNTTLTTNGNIPLTAKAYDAAGNVGTATINVTVNNNITVPSEKGTLDIELLEGGQATPTQDQFLWFNFIAPVLGFKVTAQNEPIKLTSFTVSSKGSLTVDTIAKVTVYKKVGTGPLEQLFTSDTAQKNCPKTATNYCDYTWSGSDVLNGAIDPATPVSVYFSVASGVAGKARIGENFSFVTDKASLQGQGTVSKQAITIPAMGNTIVSGAYTTTISQGEVRIETEFPTETMQNVVPLGGSPSIIRIATVKVHNYGLKTIYLNKLWLEYIKYRINYTTPGTVSPDYRLILSNSTNLTVAADIVNHHPNVAFQNFGIAVAPGQTRYFTAALDDLTAAVSGNYWQLKVVDAAYSLYEADVGYDHNGDGFISGQITSIPAQGRPAFGETLLTP